MLLNKIQEIIPTATQEQLNKVLEAVGKSEKEVLENESYFKAVLKRIENAQTGLAKLDPDPKPIKKEANNVSNLAVAETPNEGSKLTVPANTEAKTIKESVQDSAKRRAQATANLVTGAQDAVSDTLESIESRSDELLQKMIKDQNLIELAAEQVAQTKLKEIQNTLGFFGLNVVNQGENLFTGLSSAMDVMEAEIV